MENVQIDRHRRPGGRPRAVLQRINKAGPEMATCLLLGDTLPDTCRVRDEGMPNIQESGRQKEFQLPKRRIDSLSLGSGSVECGVGAVDDGIHTSIDSKAVQMKNANFLASPRFNVFNVPYDGGARKVLALNLIL